MFSLAYKAFAETFSPPFRKVLWRSLGMTLVLMTILGAGGYYGIQEIPHLSYEWANGLIEIVAAAFLVIALFFLAIPVTTLFAGLYLEEVAAVVEEIDYPQDAAGTDQPFFPSLWVAIKFTTLLIGLNILILPLIFVPPLYPIVAWGLNAYLLSREYFELVALRHMSEKEAAALRQSRGIRIWASGLIVAGFAAIPILNLFTPLFGTAYMVHIFKKVSAPHG
ncbi:MAG: EI24 domain-containing protein [Parvibaculaceae bacterium]|nr:EI24 domain-containing protein [Parvibaculaceae bacterium]